MTEQYKIHFKKYHGLGNDYLVIDPDICDFNLTPQSIQLICDRNYGIGSDGILYGPIKDAETLKVRIFNPDGSEAEKSGNGLRIFARYLFEQKYVNSKNFKIDTIGGTVEAQIIDAKGSLIKINMGQITFQSDQIPVNGPKR